MAIVFPHIEPYLRSLLPERDELLSALEREAADTATYAPIIVPEIAQLLRVLCRLVRPRRILELGTAIGYSAIVMAEASPDAEVITVERYDAMYERALANIRRAGLEKRVRPVLDEVANALSWLEGPFDLIFLDAAKGQYGAFFPDCLRLLSPHGVIVSDDVLYKGEVSGDADIEKRKETLVERLDTFLCDISRRDDLLTAVLPIGSGVALTVPKGELHE